MNISEWLKRAEAYILWLINPMPVPWSNEASTGKSTLPQEGAGILGSGAILAAFYMVPLHFELIVAEPPPMPLASLLALFLLALVSPVLKFFGHSDASFAVFTSQWVLRLLAIQWIFIVLFAQILTYLQVTDTKLWAPRAVPYGATALLTSLMAGSSMRVRTQPAKEIAIALGIFLVASGILGWLNLAGLKPGWWNFNP